MNAIGARYPERVAALVYLNSAEDPTLGPADYGAPPGDAKKLPASMREPSKPDKRSFGAYREWQKRAYGVAFPESELRQLYTANPDASMGNYTVPAWVRDAMFKGIEKPDFARIRVPVLAFFALPLSLESQVEQYKPQSQEERDAVAQKYAADRAIRERHKRDLLAGVPSAHVIELPGANFYIFLSNEGEIVREMRSFAAGL